MKKLKNIISIIFLGFSCSVFAAATATTTSTGTIVITGEPVVLQTTGTGSDVVYTVPATVMTTSTPYHYVTVDGTNKVCYPSKSADPRLANLTPTTINVKMSDSTSSDTQTWYCYTPDTTVFEIQPATTSTTTTTP